MDKKWYRYLFIVILFRFLYKLWLLLNLNTNTFIGYEYYWALKKYNEFKIL